MFIIKGNFCNMKSRQLQNISWSLSLAPPQPCTAASNPKTSIYAAVFVSIRNLAPIAVMMKSCPFEMLCPPQVANASYVPAINIVSYFYFIARYVTYSTGFTRKSIKISDNFEFSYIERGSAKECEISLLLVHGFTSDKESWCFMGKCIPKRIHVVALDLPGHGSTTRKEKDDISIEGLAKRVEQVNYN